MKKWAVVLAALVVLAFPAVASADFVLLGTTSQGQSVGFRVSTSLLKIKQYTIQWRAQCSSGATAVDGTAGKTRVRPFPHFSAVGSYTATALNYGAAQGQALTFVVSGSMKGTLLRNGRMRGTFRANVRVLDSNQNQIDSCSTGVVRWKARLV